MNTETQPAVAGPLDGTVRTRPVTERDMEVLRELDACRTGSHWNEQGWARPMDIGASNNSHHSGTLAKLERRGLVESRQRSAWCTRGSKTYRATAAGIELLSSNVRANRETTR